MMFFVFFSSRRRHTRSKRDWSSDVCSSDLNTLMFIPLPLVREWDEHRSVRPGHAGVLEHRRAGVHVERSEERRVGKEWRCPWWQDQSKEKGDHVSKRQSASTPRRETRIAAH